MTTDADLRQEILNLVRRSGASGDEVRDVAERLEELADLRDREEEVMLR